jgi:hypothetical protein
MEDLFREILAPLPPPSPVNASSSLALPLSNVFAPEKAQTQAGKDEAAQIAPSGGEMGGESGMDLGMGGIEIGMDMNMGSGVDMGESQQWTANETEMQRILETLGQGYEHLLHQQQQELERELGWDAFGATVPGVGVF